MPALWILKHEIKTESGQPIEFEKRKFQWDMYNDMSPNQVTLKPPQVGETVKNLIKSFYIAHKLHKDIIYTLPTQGDVNDMAGGKINRIIAQNPILREWIKDHDTVEQKKVGDSVIYYRGTFTNKAAMMVSSGLNIHDEVDASDPQIITQYETRLQAEEDGGWRWYFSHPSLSSHGVDVYWQQSDKKEWYITCSKCNAEQVMTFPDNIDFDTEEYICSLCKGTLDEQDRISGVWRNKDGELWNGVLDEKYLFSGWHISQMMVYNKSAKDILTVYNDPLKDRQYFWNYVLGLPYVSSEDRIEPAVVLRNCVDTVNEHKSVTVIGMDTGHDIHYVLMNKEGVFYYNHADEITATKDPYDEVESLLKRFPRSIVVSDQGGDLIGIRKLQAKFPGRVFLCFYRKDRKSMEVIQWKKGEDFGTVVVDRNRMMQIVIEQMRDIGRIRLNGTREEWAEFASHFGNIYREKVAIRNTRQKDNRELYGAEYVWKRNGPDHLCHALLYAMVGLQKYGGEMATVVGDDINKMPTGQMARVIDGATVVAEVSPRMLREQHDSVQF